MQCMYAAESRATYLEGGKAEKREMGAVHRTLMLLAGVYAQFFMRLYRVAWLTGMVEWVTTRIARVARLGAGGCLCVPRTGNPKANAKALVLYEYMGCPFCRYVREAVSGLDLLVLIHPTPRESLTVNGFIKDSRFRKVVLEKGGKAQFPYLEDPNCGQRLYDSGIIVKHLWDNYGGSARKPLMDRALHFSPTLDLITSIWATVVRPLPDMGIMRVPSREPRVPLLLIGAEGVPEARLVMELLCSLELS